jgi:RsmE family RNA methyltransferase
MILGRYFPTNEYARVIAHPTRIDDPMPAKRMRDCTFPESDRRRILVAVGPEGGWEEPDELELFTRLGFTQITLGSRTLRSDCAVVSLLSLAHDVCSDSDCK